MGLWVSRVAAPALSQARLVLSGVGSSAVPLDDTSLAVAADEKASSLAPWPRLSLLFVMLGLCVAPLGANTPEKLEIPNPDAWNCATTIAVKPFPVAGTFKGQQPREAYMRLLVDELRTLLVAAGVKEVTLLAPGGQPGADATLAIEGEFLELNTGSRAKRFWVGFGAGKSKCEVNMRGLTNPGRAPVFTVRHDRLSAMGLDKDELAENVVEVARDIGRALAQARGPCVSAQRVGPAEPLAPAAVPSPTATFDITSEPTGAEVYVDGELVGSTPVTAYTLAAGRHEIEFRKKGFRAWKRNLTVASSQQGQLNAELEPAETTGPLDK